MADASHMFSKSLAVFEENTANPVIYLQSQTQESEKFTSITKSLYDSISTDFAGELKNRILPKLITSGFDAEQVWQQLELRNTAILPLISKKVSKVRSKQFSFRVKELEEVERDDPLFDDGVVGDDSVSSAGDERYAFDGDSDSSGDLPKKPTKRKQEEEVVPKKPTRQKQEEEVVPKKPTRQKQEQEVVPKRSKPYATEVDDQFFKVSKLSQFLRLEDLKEERGVEQDSEDDIDLFGDIPSDLDDVESDEENEPTSAKQSSRNLMYEDFFDPPDSADESIDQEESESEEHEDFDDEMQDAEGNVGIEDSEAQEVEEKKVKTPTEKTPFQIEQEKIRKKIQQCERNLLQPLPWQLTGEVTAMDRPANSLLHQDTTFDSNTKQDLVVDDVLTDRTEKIITLAIINKAFNDVERKVKPIEDALAYKKEVVLEQAKSKKSLAQVYEADYLKKQQKDVEEENPKHKDIKKLMDSLFPELYALFSHIPKPAIPDVKIVSNLPAITVEEVAPIGISDATLLTPAEVKKATGLIKGQTERTDTDRKRERRKKKVLQKVKQKKTEKMDAANTNPTSAKTKKKEKLLALKKLKQNKNTIISENAQEKIKSSTDFFSRLQDTVDSKAASTKKSKLLKKSKQKH